MSKHWHKISLFAMIVFTWYTSALSQEQFKPVEEMPLSQAESLHFKAQDNATVAAVVAADTVQISPGGTRSFTETVPGCAGGSYYYLESVLPDFITHVSKSVRYDIINNRFIISFDLEVSSSAPAGFHSVKLTYNFHNNVVVLCRAILEYIVDTNPVSPPTANFSGSPLSGAKPLTVNLTDQSTGQISSRSWNFGDGQTSTATNPSHTYSNAGSYTVSLTATGPGGSNTKTRSNYITVTEPAVIGLSPSSFQFTAIQGGSNPSPKTLSIGNSGGSGSTLNWSASDNANWLTLSPVSGSIAAGGSQNVSLSVSLTGLSPGTYNATVTVTASNASNSPRTASVTLTVQSPAPRPSISLSSRAYQFTATEGGSNPPAQTLNISNTGDSGSTMNWSVTENAAWLTLSPTSGSLATGSSQSVTLSVNIAGLASGTHNANVTVTDPNATNSPQTVTVGLTIAPANTFCSADVPKSIPDVDSTTSTFTINDDLIIGDVNVRLFISHSYDTDLDVFLTSPSGLRVELFSDLGGSGNNFGSTCSPSPNCVIDDQAANNIAGGSAPFVGSFQSEGQTLSAFNGENAKGNWTFTVVDDGGGDTGTLNCWCLEIEPAPANDIGVAAIDLPKLVLLGSSASVGVEVKNLGSSPQNNFSVSYRINNGSPVTETFAGTLEIGARATKTFAEQWTPATEGTYRFTAWTAMSGDVNTTNDTLPTPKQVVVRESNASPVLAGINNFTVRAGATRYVPIAAIDADGDSMSFSIPLNPGFLSISGISQNGDTAAATLVISPPRNLKGEFSASVEARDEFDAVSTIAFMVQVVPRALNAPANLQASLTQNEVQLNWEAPAIITNSPYAGIWRGNTSQSLPAFMSVTDDGFIDSLNVRFRTNWVTFYCTSDFPSNELVEIKDGKLDAYLSGYPVTSVSTTLHGTFTSESTVGGTYDESSGGGYVYCGGSFSFGFGGTQLSAGTWQATKTIPGGGSQPPVLQGYNVYRSSQPNARLTGSRIGNVDGATTFVDPNPENGTYFYQVTARYDLGESDASNETSILITGVEDRVAGLPTEYALEQNYPNPFNPETEIRFQLPKAGPVVLKIFNILGAEVRRLVDEDYVAGYHSVSWDGKDKNGRLVASGVYFYQMLAGSFSEVRKMSLLR